MTRVGIVGAGGMGSVHARQYRKMSDVELYFFDRDSERSKGFQEKFGATPIESFVELLKRVDVVDICLPTDNHLQAVLEATAAGRAIIVEKPIARTLEEARSIEAITAKAGVPLMVAQVVRYFPEYRNAHDLVMAGKVGKPSAARMHRGGSAPTGFGGWFMDHARSGGVFIDLAIHDFDWITWTLGDVSSVYARSVAATRGSGADYGLATLTLATGCIAHVESTWMDPAGFRTTFEVAGSQGLIEYDSRRNVGLQTSKPSLNDSGNYLPGSSSTSETPMIGTDDPYYKELRAFLDAIQNAKPVPVSATDGLRSLAIAIAALESAKTGLPVKPQV